MARYVNIEEPKKRPNKTKTSFGPRFAIQIWPLKSQMMLLLKLMMMMMKFFDIVDADYKSQILPNFQINCLRTLLPKQRHTPPPQS